MAIALSGTISEDDKKKKTIYYDNAVVKLYKAQRSAHAPADVAAILGLC